ncbi:MAG TPA: hypothetical protein ENH01_13505 [Nitrospirae bacterium]|nr:hypothetical protein [Nitrospirota bacterium]
MISGIASSGLMSGLDVYGLVDQILQVEQRPITVLQLRQNDYELKIASILNLSTKLASYKTSLEALNSVDKFNTKTASVTKTSGGTELLTVSSSNSAAEGSYSIKVNQLAAAGKKASQGWVDQNLTAINSSGGTFKFKVGSSGAEKSISVSSTMTLQGLRDAINTANSGVTASIINDGTGSNPYRLILTANDSGSSNDIIITEGATAEALGFTDGSANAPKIIEAAYAYTDNSYSGTVASNNGNNYTGTTNKTFLLQVVSAGESATATYKYSVDGGINWLGYGGVAYDSTASDDTSGGAITTSASLKAIDGSGATNEGVTASFTSGSTLAVGDKFTIDVFNPEMQEAKDAVIVIDNVTIVKSTNTITDAIQGITMDLLQVDTDSTLTLTVSSSSSSAKSDIGSFVDSYNDLFEFINEQLSYDPDEGTANPLIGDPTLLEIKRKIGNTISGTIPGLSTASYTNLSQIGITTDYKTGKLSISDSKLNSALSADPDAVSKLFIGTAVPTNQAITFESKTSETLAGIYGISISAAPEQASLTGDNDLSSTVLGSEEILIFKYSDNYTETDKTFTAFSVTLTAGSTINTIVNTLNSGFATNNAGFTASNSSGKLKITSNDYGADIWFQVSSNQVSDTDNDQIWDKTTWDNATDSLLSDAGVDIAGSINNHVAIGKGNVLTAAPGFSEGGLKISTTSNQTGLFGTISVSLGIADRLPSTLEYYVESESGILKSKETSLQDSIDDIDARILIMQKRLEDKEERLLSEFTRLEVLLSKYDAISQYLTSVLDAIPKIGEY